MKASSRNIRIQRVSNPRIKPKTVGLLIGATAAGLTAAAVSGFFQGIFNYRPRRGLN